MEESIEKCSTSLLIHVPLLPNFMIYFPLHHGAEMWRSMSTICGMLDLYHHIKRDKDEL